MGHVEDRHDVEIDVAWNGSKLGPMEGAGIVIADSYGQFALLRCSDGVKAEALGKALREALEKFGAGGVRVNSGRAVEEYVGWTEFKD
jgi:hypothetical protein